MTSAAVALRTAIRDRLATSDTFAKVRTVPAPPAAVGDCPMLSVFILRETRTPDGDSNVGAYDFMNDILIGIEITRAKVSTDALDVAMDADVPRIEALLTDATFTKRAPGGLFESIESFTIARLWPNDGEAYFGQLRAEITFRTRVEFAPTVTDNFETVDVMARPAEGSPDAPPIHAQWHLQTQEDE